MLKNWITYVTFLAVALAFALLYPGEVSASLFYALLALPILSLLLLVLPLYGFRYEQRLDRMTAVKGDVVNYQILVKNRGFVLLPYVEFLFHDGRGILAEGLHPQRLSVLPFRSTTVDVKVLCRLKGSFEIGIRQIRYQDFLGLFAFRQKVKPLGSLLICPRIVPIGSFPGIVAGDAVDSGTHAGQSLEKTETISEIRKYASGDRLRAIHWKLSAKKDELMVKNFEQAASESVHVLVDAASLGGTPLEAALAEDKLAECAVSLAHYFAAHSIPSVLCLWAKKPVRLTLGSMRDFEPAYRLLAEAEPGQELSAGALAELLSDGGGRKTLVILTARLTPALCGFAVSRLSSGSYVILLQVAAGDKGQAVDTAETTDALALAGVKPCLVGLDSDIGAALAAG